MKKSQKVMISTVQTRAMIIADKQVKKEADKKAKELEKEKKAQEKFAEKEKKKQETLMKKLKIAEEAKAKREEDKYTPDILRVRYTMYRDMHIATAKIIETTGLPIRHQNPPEDISENIAKFIIQNFQNDSSCKWAKAIGKKGDLSSEKYSASQPPEVKSFTSDGPSSFGPKKKFGGIYFLDMRNWLTDSFILWYVNLTDESPAWKNLKMNKKQTNQEQCDEMRRPHISWDKIYPQVSEHCEKVYEGTFEGIFKTTF